MWVPWIKLGTPSLPGMHFYPMSNFSRPIIFLVAVTKKKKNWQKLLKEGRILSTSLCKGTVHHDEKGVAMRAAAALVETSKAVGQAVSVVWAQIAVNPGLSLFLQFLSQRDGVFQFRDGSFILRQASLEILSQAHLEAYLLGDSKPSQADKEDALSGAARLDKCSLY